MSEEKIGKLENICRATGRGLIPEELRSRWDVFGAVSPDFASEWWGGPLTAELALSQSEVILTAIENEMRCASQVKDDEARWSAFYGIPVRARRRDGVVEGFIVGGKKSDFPRRDGSVSDAFLLFDPKTGEGAWVGDNLEPRIPETGEGGAFNFAVSAPLDQDPPRGWDDGDAEVIISDLVPVALRGKKKFRPYPSMGRTRKGIKTRWYEVSEGTWFPRRWFR